ncbi:peptidyl-Lys metalloendopeptidase [Ceratobasidium sp. AG-Ba]|nr:peptidyl-Lys metalloendopeptidase [Ceratobasidium sp. AG-Ba]
MLRYSCEDVDGEWTAESIPYVWFGEWNSERGTVVRDVIEAINYRGTYDYVFSCDQCADKLPNTVAWVSSSTFPLVTLCPEFWNPHYSSLTERAHT